MYVKQMFGTCHMFYNLLSLCNFILYVWLIKSKSHLEQSKNHISKISMASLKVLTTNFVKIDNFVGKVLKFA